MLLHLNIRVWLTRSHPSKGENRTRNRRKRFPVLTYDISATFPEAEHFSQFLTSILDQLF